MSQNTIIVVLIWICMESNILPHNSYDHHNISKTVKTYLIRM